MGPKLKPEAKSWIVKHKLWLKKRVLEAGFATSRPPLRRMTQHIEECDESIWASDDDASEVIIPPWPLIYREGDDNNRAIQTALKLGLPVIIAKAPGPIEFPKPWGNGSFPPNYMEDYMALRAKFASNPPDKS